jgi:catechol 2,3-dioxygenase-like lactoylglutathione lyase family enzyme
MPPSASYSLAVGIVVRDLEAATRFYRDVLCLRLDGDLRVPGTTTRSLASGVWHVNLLKLDDQPTAANPRGGVRAATGLRLLTLFVADIDEIVDRCREVTGSISQPRTEVAPGIFVAGIEDPDGTWIELVEGYSPDLAALHVDLSAMSVTVSRRFAANPNTVWDLLSDVEAMAGLGPEHAEAK